MVDPSTGMICPITRELVSRDGAGCFYFQRAGDARHSVVFDASALIDYMLASGDFSDPESRLPFSVHDLQRLDAIGKRLGKPSMVERCQSTLQSEREDKFMQDALFGLERLCGELVSQLFDMVEEVDSGKRSFEDACIQVDGVILPDLADCLTQLMEADALFAKASVATFETFLLGPPNHRVPQTRMQLVVLESYRNAVEEAHEMATNMEASTAAEEEQE